MSGTWLEHDRNLDYTLVQAPAGENPAATYGWLTLDLELPDIGEYMYIVGHPSGRPKEKLAGSGRGKCPWTSSSISTVKSFASCGAIRYRPAGRPPSQASSFKCARARSRGAP